MIKEKSESAHVIVSNTSFTPFGSHTKGMAKLLLFHSAIFYVNKTSLESRGKLRMLSAFLEMLEKPYHRLHRVSITFIVP